MAENKGKARSRGYPSTALERIIASLGRLVEILGRGPFEKDAIAQALELGSASSGETARTVAAFRHYGLFETRDRQHALSQLATNLLTPDDEVAWGHLLQDAFLHVRIFREVVDDHQYSEDRRLPRSLSYLMYSRYGITEGKKDEVAGIFLDGAKYARILRSDGRFTDQFLRQRRIGPKLKADQDQFSQELGKRKLSARPNQHLENPEIQHFKFDLTDGKQGEVQMPRGLNDQDLLILDKVLETLRAQVEASRVAPPLVLRTLKGGR